MSDLGRKSFTDKASEKLTPQDQKSYAEQGKEFVTDKVDKAQSALQPEGGKSTTQQLGDSVQKGHDDAKGEGKSLSETAGEYVESAKQSLNDAAEYVSSSLTGAKEGAEKGAK
jgi:hypothetical protein